ncbi:MAG: extracellular solute-binding protein [Acetobacteraceae bacterium]|nr:extracellular solute-binding protein [Acetobacteraceae bacterium]MCX7686075.1 extracellular solute-binding protein [Acetobacteraceae bacterium]MDW8397916.1 extracellular solute-binding protein [Acetobacteraceae bacterium]
MPARRHLLLSALAAPALIAPARAQAPLTIYTAGPQNLIDSLVSGFRAAGGPAANVFQATTGRVMARLEAERANPIADVVISASWSSARDLKAQNLLLPYLPAAAAAVPPALKDGHYVAQAVSGLGIVWNSRSGTPRPAEWDDLARPEFRNLVTLPDPAQSGSNFDLIAGLLAARGDAAWELFAALRRNGAIVAGANQQALNPVLQGAKAAVFGAVDYIALEARARGESVEVIFPASGTVIAPRPAMILASSRNQEAARRFLDYMLSDDGQRRIARLFLMPSRADIPAERPTIAELRVLGFDETAAEARRADILARFRQVMGV